MSMMRIIVLHLETNLTFVGFPVPKISHIFRLSINRPGDVDFDLLTS